MKENVPSERSIYQTEREAEDGLYKRYPLKCRDLFVGDRENDKSLEHNNFNGCRPQFDVVEVPEDELPDHK